VYMVYPEVFPIITAMLEYGLRSIVQDRSQEKPVESHSSSPALKPQRNSSPMKPDREGGKTRNSSGKTDLFYFK
jgi:hypothetical protein